MEPGFWNAKYAQESFAYGLQANAYVSDAAARYTGGQGPLNVADLASGEGRNAVHLAKVPCLHGWALLYAWRVIGSFQPK
jgi:hypothetical protein